MDTDQQQKQQPQSGVPQGHRDTASSPDKSPENPKDKLREQRLVEQWTTKIKNARSKWEDDFKTMRADMKFARGIQWPGQKDLMDDRYICNLVQRNINQGVAQLYARNPECEATRRDRMDFEMWDGKEASIMQAQQVASAMQMGFLPPDPKQFMLATALIKDYSEGQMWRDLVDRVGKTVTYICQYMMDSLQPSFKLQMKQLIRRVKTTGVAYVQVNYVDGFEGTLSTSETESTITDRAKSVAHSAEKLGKSEDKETDPEVLTLAMKAQSIMQSLQTGDTQNINQRITFDFLPSTSVIIDPKCRALKGFVGSRWMAIERFDLIDTVNAFYETQIEGDKVTDYNEGRAPETNVSAANSTTSSPKKPKRVCLWDVYDLDSKSCFVLVDGWKEFVQEPEAVMPETNHFWPVVALTFNDVETDPNETDCGSIFPPSDVTQMRSAQKEWNRTRNALRSHRVANTPCYMVGKGWLTQEDKEKINDHEDSAVIELEGAQMGQDINKLLSPFAHSPLQPQLYDTAPLVQDIQLSAGTQEADLGRPTPRVTATGATIAEQSKNSVAASNTDDVDDFLSEIAQMVGEIIIRYFQLDTAKRIAGRGAVLPQENREDFLNEIMLSVKAASSGKPNKALEISNFKELVPLIMQAIQVPTGPMIGLAEEGIKRLDDRLDLSKLLAQGPPPQPQQGQQQQAKPNTPNHEPLPNGSPVHSTQ